MKHFLFSVGLFVSITFVHPTFAYEIRSLRDVYNAAAGLYDSGQDNNSIEWKILSKNQFLRFTEKKISVVLQANASSQEPQALNAISECVFFAKGAYGDHLSPEAQNNLSFKFLYNVLFSLPVDLIKVEGAFQLSDHPLYTSSCVLGIQLGEEVLLLQGVTVD